MARRVDEGDTAARRRRDLIRADMLSDAAGFARRDLRGTDGVKQRCLAVVDMAHDGHDRRAGQQLLRIVRDVEHAFFDVRLGDPPHSVAELFGDKLCGIGVDRVCARGHVALLHEHAHHIDRTLGHAIGRILDGDRFRNDDLADDLFLGLGVTQPTAAPFAAAERGV